MRSERIEIVWGGAPRSISRNGRADVPKAATRRVLRVLRLPGDVRCDTRLHPAGMPEGGTMDDWEARWSEAMQAAHTAETWQERDSWTRHATEVRLAAAAMGRRAKEQSKPKPKRKSKGTAGAA